ncbi:hypothetical protein CH254_27460 [Rhodococcus sp. 06-412-2C]|uniref:hypothetical protein n=1 Tax=unclassified Rhodococcus (in: high G+C Gram-positive bacteria) TaxID=192944 RepID=UPI000B9AAA6A|nr:MULTISPECIES: hypothetical protein [unclassified Rhodococcus (in: high G+C Gram-positive bacteria)]OZC82045.1 hypothetical protein CH254_27460 [Rhodococcus sp. 06-412-2C]OZC94980.1 hypothetical protein CH279_16815 [Rhodococcus sp. 06-412-2B]
MTITTDRPTTAGVRTRSTVVERRRRARPALRSSIATRGSYTTPCLPVLEPSWSDITDREAADREFDETSAHFAGQPVRMRSLVLWVLAVVVVAGGLIGVANLRAASPDAGVQPAGVVEVHDGAVVEYAPGR